MAPAFKSEVDAAQPAQELMNQRGGVTVNGQKYNVEIVTGDDMSTPDGAVAAAQKLIQDGVKFMIAPMFIPSNMAIASVCEEAKVLRVVPNCADPAPFGPPNLLCFNSQPSIYNIPYVYDKVLSLYPQVKKVAIIFNDDPGAKTITDATVKEIEKRGLQVVFNEGYASGTADFYPIVTKALAQKPDSIECIYSIIPWAKGIIEGARQMGFTGPIGCVSSFGGTRALVSVLDPKYATDIYHANPDVSSPQMLPIVQDFGKLVEKDTTDLFDFDHVLTLQALWVILQGIDKAQSFDTGKVANALETMESVDTPYGPGKFVGQDLIGVNHLLFMPIPFSRIMNGKVEFEFLPVNISSIK